MQTVHEAAGGAGFGAERCLEELAGSRWRSAARGLRTALGLRVAATHVQIVAVTTPRVMPDLRPIEYASALAAFWDPPFARVQVLILDEIHRGTAAITP
jgi:hypothetical protein